MASQGNNRRDRRRLTWFVQSPLNEKALDDDVDKIMTYLPDLHYPAGHLYKAWRSGEHLAKQAAPAIPVSGFDWQNEIHFLQY